jgi:hypothetical protein
MKSAISKNAVSSVFCRSYFPNLLELRPLFEA